VEGQIMAEDTGRSDSEKKDYGSELADLRVSVADLARKLQSYGLDRLEALRDEVEKDTESLTHEGRRRAQDMRERLGEVEVKVERHVREHPLTWIGGVLGAIGFGLILGMILRRRD
jgi:ElaB/YqjD/DUF883 family membrane-anchored ribosome-binding protein